MIKIFEKITSTILSKWEKIGIEILNYFIWICLVVVTYNKWVGEIKTDDSNLIKAFISGSYILFIAWSICIVVIYNVLRFFLINLASSAKIGNTLVAKFLPDEYQALPLNIYYEQAILTNEKYLNNQIAITNKDGSENVETNFALNLMAGIVLKIILLLIVAICNSTGLALLVVIISILLCFFTLAFLVAALSSIKSKEQLVHFLKRFIDA